MQETDSKDGYAIASFTTQEEEITSLLSQAPGQALQEKLLKRDLGYLGAERGHKAWTAIRVRLEASGHLQVRHLVHRSMAGWCWACTAVRVRLEASGHSSALQWGPLS